MDTQQDQNNNLQPTENEQLRAQLQRALADYANLQKRYEKEKEEVVKFSNELLLMQLINVVDGFEMTFTQLQKLLTQNGFTKKEVSIGTEFNAEVMEAVETDGKGNKVVAVYAPAYSLHGKIIRPAKVKVGEKEEK